ncbi:MAG: hypothetical protein AAGA99_23625 [Actinomycetota bacterium]
MSIRRFLRALFKPTPSTVSTTPQKSDGLVEEIRETLGPQAGGGLGGRMTGSAVYRRLEDRGTSSSNDVG